MQPGQGYPRGGGRTWFRALRWVLVAGTLAVAAVLISRHDYVIGYLIGGLALVRVVYLVGTTRRPMPGRARYGAGQAWPAGGGGLLRELARPEFAVAAREIGIQGQDMRRGFDEGRSIAELAARAGVPLERVVNAMVADATETIDRKVAAGEISEQQGLSVKARIPVWADRLAHFHKGDLRRVRN
jgi:hypothetical protein